MSIRITLANWDDGGALSRYAYQHTAEIFPAATVPRGAVTAPLALHNDPRVADWVVRDGDAGPVTLAAHVHRSLADGLIVVHRGAIVFESYPRMMPDRPHLLFSVTKAFVGTLVAILEARGSIDLDTTIDRYLPALRGSAWAGTPVRDLLEMASGMQGEEPGRGAAPDPLDPHYMMEASLGWLPKDPRQPPTVLRGDTRAWLASLQRLEPPGTRRAYASVNTAVLGWLIETVTDRPLATVLAEEIVGPMGAQSDALLATSPAGVPLAHAGLQMTLRDLARFGLLFTPSAPQLGAEPVISAALLARMQTGGRTRVFAATADGWERHGGYHWDAVTRDGDLIQAGFGNQKLFVSPTRDLVVAWVGVNASRATDRDVDLPLQRMASELF